jgi:hypothetical protein
MGGTVETVSFLEDSGSKKIDVEVSLVLVSGFSGVPAEVNVVDPCS